MMVLTTHCRRAPESLGLLLLLPAHLETFFHPCQRDKTQDSIQELKDTRVAARNMKNNMDEMEKGELKSANLASSTYDAYSKLAPALQNIVRMAKKK